MSRPPKLWTAPSIAARTCASSATSHGKNRASAPASTSAAAVAVPASTSTSSRATRAPSSAKRRAMPSPWPFAAPVTTATLPFSRPPVIGSAFRLVRQEGQGRRLYDLDRKPVRIAGDAAFDAVHEHGARVFLDPYMLRALLAQRRVEVGVVEAQMRVADLVRAAQSAARLWRRIAEPDDLDAHAVALHENALEARVRDAHHAGRVGVVEIELGDDLEAEYLGIEAPRHLDVRDAMRVVQQSCVLHGEILNCVTSDR